MRRVALALLVTLVAAGCSQASTYGDSAVQWAKQNSAGVASLKQSSDALGITPSLQDCPKLHQAKARLDAVPNLPVPDLQAKLDNARIATGLAAQACDAAVVAKDSAMLAEASAQLKVAREQLDQLSQDLS